jgi:transcription elongation factor GreA
MHEFMTTIGRDKLIEKIRLLKGALKKVRAQKGEVAERDGNSWHDNFAFEELERQERMLMGQIAREQARLNSAKVVEKKAGNTIGIGSKVTVEFTDGEKMLVEIVGAEESDPSAGKTSYQSPLGQALMGAKVGETRECVVDGKIIRIRIK